jgi:hypothetical protein
MRLLGNAIKLIDFLSQNRTVDTWFETVSQLLQGYQYGPRVFTYLQALQNIPNATYTNVQYGLNNISDSFPVARIWWDPIIQKFQPGIEGYFQINAAIAWGIANPGYISLWKNGVTLMAIGQGSSSNVDASSISTCVYLKKTDYLEIKAYQTSGITQTIVNTAGSFFNAYLARPA